VAKTEKEKLGERTWREKVRKLQTRVHTIVRPSSPATLFLFLSITPASSSLAIPLRASCSYNPQITNLTLERLKDQALFEVDSKEVIPAQDLARIHRKKSTKEYDEILFSARKISLFLTNAVCLWLVMFLIHTWRRAMVMLAMLAIEIFSRLPDRILAFHM